MSSISGSDTDSDDAASTQRIVQKSAQLIFRSSGAISHLTPAHGMCTFPCAQKPAVLFANMLQLYCMTPCICQRNRQASGQGKAKSNANMQMAKPLVYGGRCCCLNKTAATHQTQSCCSAWCSSIRQQVAGLSCCPREAILQLLYLTSGLPSMPSTAKQMALASKTLLTKASTDML